MGSAMRVFGALHGGLYRLSGGRLGGKVGTAPILLLTVTGRKSGQPRTVPLGFSRDGARLLVVASALGAPNDPAWYRNLRDHPRVTVRLGAETRSLIAETATGEERAQLWQRLIIEFPHFVEHQRKTTRELPVVILSRG